MQDLSTRRLVFDSHTAWFPSLRRQAFSKVEPAAATLTPRVHYGRGSDLSPSALRIGGQTREPRLGALTSHSRMLSCSRCVWCSQGTPRTLALAAPCSSRARVWAGGPRMGRRQVHGSRRSLGRNVAYEAQSHRHSSARIYATIARLVGGPMGVFYLGRRALKTYECARESSRSAVCVLARAETERYKF
jgi:hypothetical protein